MLDTLKVIYNAVKEEKYEKRSLFGQNKELNGLLSQISKALNPQNPPDYSDLPGMIGEITDVLWMTIRKLKVENPSCIEQALDAQITQYEQLENELMESGERFSEENNRLKLENDSLKERVRELSQRLESAESLINEFSEWKRSIRKRRSSASPNHGTESAYEQNRRAQS